MTEVQCLPEGELQRLARTGVVGEEIGYLVHRRPQRANDGFSDRPHVPRPEQRSSSRRARRDVSTGQHEVLGVNLGAACRTCFVLRRHHDVASSLGEAAESLARIKIGARPMARSASAPPVW